MNLFKALRLNHCLELNRSLSTQFLRVSNYDRSNYVAKQSLSDSHKLRQPVQWQLRESEELISSQQLHLGVLSYAQDRSLVWPISNWKRYLDYLRLVGRDIAGYYVKGAVGQLRKFALIEKRMARRSDELEERVAEVGKIHGVSDV